MALFFDASWFDARLSARGLSRADAAQALRLNAEELADLWKDQRELTVADVRTLAALIGAPAQEVATRAGVSTPIPVDAPVDMSAVLVELGERLTRIERGMVELKALLLDLRKSE